MEDQENIANFIKTGLQKASYEVDVVHNGNDALAAALDTENSYAAIIMDLLLPGRDGLAIVREMRERGSTVSVLALTARNTVLDRVQGLDEGCDDYLCKPFAFEELLARLRSLQRRQNNIRGIVQLSYAGLTLTPSTRQAVRDGKTIELTNTEYALLEMLIRHKGNVLTRTDIMSTVWGWNFDVDNNVLNVYMTMLRKKVDQGFARPLLHTVRHVGYKLE